MRRVIAALRATLALATVVVAAFVMADGVRTLQHGATLLTQPATAAAERRQYDLLACRERQFRAAIPAGAHVYIATTDGVLAQRLAEWASGWALPVPAASQATYEVRQDGAGHGCAGGLGFTVSRT